MRQTDQDLLAEFVASRSERAFCVLVERNIDHAHSVACHITGDAEIARDVVQQVFARLASEAPTIPRRIPLQAWLHTKARSQAIDAVRSEQARRDRESRYADHTQMSANQDDEPSWENLRPVLDEAIDQLKPMDRQTIVLRFYRSLSHADVGRELRISPNTARVRVQRALDKLRRVLARKGITTTTAALTAILPAHAVSPAPSSLCASVAQSAYAAALGPAIATTGVVTPLSLTLFTMVKIKTTVIVATLIGMISLGVWQQRRIGALKEENRLLLHQASDEGAAGIELKRTGSRLETIEREAANDLSTSLADLRTEVGYEVPRSKIEAYLKDRQRSAMALIAAGLASGDQSLLREAAERFPDDAHVQFVVVAHDLFPDRRREWIARLKASDPDNALASYLMAAEMIGAGEIETGIGELRMAARQNGFEDYATQSMLAVEELYLAADRSPLMAKWQSSYGLALPHLSALRELANNVKTIRDEEAGSELAGELTALGAAMGNQMSQGAGNRLLLNEAIGIKIEQSFLGDLPPDSTSPYGDLTVGEAVEELNAQLQRVEEATSAWDPSKLTESQAMGFIDRTRLLGEQEAVAWLKAQTN